MSEYTSALGGRVRALRRERFDSVEALALAAGISAASLWRIEQGKADPKASTVAKLAAALEVSTDVLLGDEAA